MLFSCVVGCGARESAGHLQMTGAARLLRCVGPALRSPWRTDGSTGGRLEGVVAVPAHAGLDTVDIYME